MTLTCTVYTITLELQYINTCSIHVCNTCTCSMYLHSSPPLSLSYFKMIPHSLLEEDLIDKEREDEEQQLLKDVSCTCTCIHVHVYIHVLYTCTCTYKVVMYVHENKWTIVLCIHVF